MGGIMHTPSPPPTPQPTMPEPARSQEEDRLDALERRRRGRAGTILTTDRGLMKPTINSNGTKDLLGE